MLTLDLPITPEEEDAWRAMPVSARVTAERAEENIEEGATNDNDD